MQQIQISLDLEGQRFDKFLFKYLDDAPKSFIYKMLRKKNIKLNQSKALGNEIIKCGDLVDIYMSDDTISNFRIDHKVPDLKKNSLITNENSNVLNQTLKNPLNNIEIIFEDKDIIILNKPVGILSQKAMKDDYSLNERIVDYYKLKNDENTLFTPSVCNRLDRNTSGILLAGMSLKGSRILSKMLQARTIDKYYITIVSGKVESTSTVKGYLVKKSSHNQVVIFRSIEEAKNAGFENPSYIETMYQPLFYGNYVNYDFTFLKVKLITGKTHQIRAHLFSHGHPIIGDGKYGNKIINDKLRKEFGLKYQLLHAYETSFPISDSDENLDSITEKKFCAKPPTQFLSILDKIFDLNKIKEKYNGYMEF